MDALVSRSRRRIMQSQCSCPKWYDVLDLDAVFALIDKYEAHPVYSKGFRACLKSTFVGCDQRDE